jgi:hypothetical protein
MIADYDGERLTPKQMAQNLLLQAARGGIYQLYDRHVGDEMTPRERQLVIAQFHKQFQRIEKLFGFPPGSWSID